MCVNCELGYLIEMTTAAIICVCVYVKRGESNKIKIISSSRTGVYMWKNTGGGE